MNTKANILKKEPLCIMRDKYQEYCYTDDFYARYIDGTLSRKEKNSFENHLIECEKCMRIVNQAFSDLFILSNNELLQVPETLLKKAKNFSFNNNKVFVAVLEKLKKSLKIISHNFSQIALVPALEFKGQKHDNGVKLESKDFDMLIQCNNDNCDVLIIFMKPFQEKIDLKKQNGDLISSLYPNNNKITYDKLKFGNYTLSFADKKVRLELK